MKNNRLKDIEFLKTFHGYMTAVWAFLLIPSLLWWKHSLLWIVLMSVWANLAGHWSAYQGARSELSNGK